MKEIRMIAAVATIVISAGLIGTAMAQDQPSQGWWPGWMMSGQRGMMGPGSMGPWMMGGSPQAMCKAMASHIEGRLAYIKAELKITEAQGSLWNAYATAARDNANRMATHCTTMMSERGASTVSLPDRLDQHEQFMAAQLDVVRVMNKTLKPLYESLNDGQKKAADQLFWGPMGMM